MANFVKFNVFTKNLVDGVHNFASHSFKLMLTNDAPGATNTVKADITEISAGSGYSAGGGAAPMASSLASATAKITATDITFTASGGPIGPFRYAALYNDTASGDPLVGYIDIGSNVTLSDGDSYVFDFDGVNGLFQVP